MIYNQFDIVVVPFPFVDSPVAKRRPAIILSSKKHFNQETKHSVMAMITSARNIPWPGDVKISDLSSAGLKKASVIRMKLFTIDHKLILERLGTLSKKDLLSLQKISKSIFENIV
ncbi:MAG TPA: type II toxin-antitoxin system PemK/MazF family toxin [Candidatus Babeliales bacterium]|nr:type II toxin-antitoxin system PemK/MazF family toxin [Candidatus Babeliales bacterium]